MKNAQLAADRLTDREVNNLAKLLTDYYNQAQKEIIGKLEAIYGKYLTTKNPQDYYNIMIQYDRLNNLLKEVQQTYLSYSKQAGRLTEQISSLSMSNTYYRQQYVSTWFTPIAGFDLKFSILDTRLIELSVTGTQDAWKQISATLGKKYEKIQNYIPQYGTLSNLIQAKDADALIKIQRAITQGFIQGDTLRKLSKDIQGVFETDKFKADRIARTEASRTANLGHDALRQDAINQGLNIQKMWIATLDERTRSSHARLDGVKKDQDEDFEIDGDTAPFPGQFSKVSLNISCRCTTVDIIDGVDPAMRRGRNPATGENEVFEFKTFDKWSEENGLTKNKYGELYKK